MSCGRRSHTSSDCIRRSRARTMRSSGSCGCRVSSSRHSSGGHSWLLGRLATSGWREVGIVLPYAVVAWALIIAHRRLLDVLSVGDDEAAALGVNVARVRLLVVAAATIATAAAVAVSGLIGFVGIIVPHTIRLLIGGSYRLLLPLCVIMGAAFLVLADVIARTVMSPAELPIGVVTAFFGAPFFAIVLRTSRMVRS